MFDARRNKSLAIKYLYNGITSDPGLKGKRKEKQKTKLTPVAVKKKRSVLIKWLFMVFFCYGKARPVIAAV